MQLRNRLTSSVLQLLALALACTAQYEPPTPQIVPLCPKGVRFSIPDEDGITLVAYHAKFNEDFNGLEAGTIARDIVKVKNGRWTYEDHTTRLRVGDVIYLWIHVVYEGLGYNLLDQSLTVTDLYNLDGSKPCAGRIPPTPIPVIPQMGGDPPNTDSDPNCRRSDTLLNGQRPCTKQLLFEEHFEKPLTSKWRVVKEIPSVPDYEFVVYGADEENLWVRNGELGIKPSLMERRYSAQYIRHGNLIVPGCTGRVGTTDCTVQAGGWILVPPVASALIDTKQSFQFLYGRIQIRAKLPQGDWLYPILGLYPVEASYGSGYQSGELRVASTVGNRELNSSTGENMDGHQLWGGAVVSVEGPIRQATMSKKVSSNYWSNDYHVYELEWTPTSITVKVDGEEYGSKENPASAHRNEIFKNTVDLWTGQNPPFDKPFYLRIGVAAGGHGQFLDNSVSGRHAKPWRNRESKDRLNFYSAQSTWANTWNDEASTLKVDYVKIWAL